MSATKPAASQLAVTTSTRRTNDGAGLVDKKRYQKPKLVDYGGIRALTASMGQDGNNDGGIFAKKTFLVQ